MCNDLWDENAAQVVCQQPGYGTAVSVPTEAHFGQGPGPVLLDNVLRPRPSWGQAPTPAGSPTTECGGDAGVIVSSLYS